MAFLPWKLEGDFHDFHHSHSVGNFASMLKLWDAVWGTNKEYMKYKAKGD
jgi:sterol desaturase/sphingolipid hydroxylase (fatty acid hydroxylase superfamily)